MRLSEYEEAGYPITMKLIEEGRDHLLLPAPSRSPAGAPAARPARRRGPLELSLETAGRWPASRSKSSS
jgi:hypothetical protein